MKLKKQDYVDTYATAFFIANGRDMTKDEMKALKKHTIDQILRASQKLMAKEVGVVANVKSAGNSVAKNTSAAAEVVYRNAGETIDAFRERANKLRIALRLPSIRVVLTRPAKK